MKTSFWQKLKKFIAEYSKYSHWHKVAVCMAAVVAVLTVSALILPAVTTVSYIHQAVSKRQARRVPNTGRSLI